MTKIGIIEVSFWVHDVDWWRPHLIVFDKEVPSTPLTVHVQDDHKDKLEQF
jgi:hypothetical protein